MTETNWSKLAEEYTKRDFTRKDWIFGYQPVLDLLGELTGKKVLDYGCGSGKFSRVLAERGAEVIATDPNEKMIALAKTNKCKGILYRQIFNNDISFVDKVDLAVATYVLCGRANDSEVIEILKRIYEKLGSKSSIVVLEPHPINRKIKIEMGLDIWLEGMTKPVFDFYRSTEEYVSLFHKSCYSLDTLLETKDGEGKPQMLIIKGKKCID